jgi:hypothetical protein
VKNDWTSRTEAADRELFARRTEALPAPEVPDLESILVQVDAAEARPAAYPAKARWVDRVQVWGPAAVLAAWFVGTVAPRGELHRDTPFREATPTHSPSLPGLVSPYAGHAEVCSAEEDLGLPVCAISTVSEVAAQAPPAMTMVSEEDPVDTSPGVAPGCERETSCLLPRR